MLRRTAAASRTTSRPATRAHPASGRSSVVRMRTAVVLPAPFGPRTPRTEPAGTARSRPASACVVPYRLARPPASIAWFAICPPFAGPPRLAYRPVSKCMEKPSGFLTGRQVESESMAGRGTRTAAARPRAEAGGAGPSTRERILDVALDHFPRRGYTETSLREIAVELGVSKAALYYHFESKQDLLMALHMRLHALTDEMLPVLEAKTDAGDVWDRLIEVAVGLTVR